jgi:hypothetical protein
VSTVDSANNDVSLPGKIDITVAKDASQQAILETISMKMLQEMDGGARVSDYVHRVLASGMLFFKRNSGKGQCAANDVPMVELSLNEWSTAEDLKKWKKTAQLHIVFAPGMIHKYWAELPALLKGKKTIVEQTLGVVVCSAIIVDMRLF